MSDSKVESLGKRRALRDGADAWTPIEAVRAFLEDMENGDIDVDRVVICFQGPLDKDGNRHIGYRQRTEDNTVAVGLLAYTQDLLINGDEGD